MIALGALVAAAAATTSVGTGLSEYRVALYRTTVRPGVVKFNVTNRGEDPHDLAVRNAKGRVVARLVPQVGPGGRAVLRVKLSTPGRYRLYCTIGDHAARGMRATLRVSTKKTPR